MLIRKDQSLPLKEIFSQIKRKSMHPHVYSGLLIITLWSGRNCVSLKNKTELVKLKKK